MWRVAPVILRLRSRPLGSLRSRAAHSRGSRATCVQSAVCTSLRMARAQRRSPQRPGSREPARVPTAERGARERRDFAGTGGGHGGGTSESDGRSPGDHTYRHRLEPCARGLVTRGAQCRRVESESGVRPLSPAPLRPLSLRDSECRAARLSSLLNLL